MEQSLGIETFRSLSQLESEMKKVESEFLISDARLDEADANLKEAEQLFLNAQLKREAALKALNECHSNIDRTLTMLRESSPAGCDWKSQADRRASGYLLGPDVLGSEEFLDTTSDFIMKA
ncbi:MAG: hypothetical protein JF595_09040 [Sphingomonadales bacterium]|nr:hypothetical protein [Sphingomonadales bacterium]